jgi:release factor glutamine methyltransferase
VALAPPDPVVVDLCCGSGALGAAFAAAVEPAELHAADVDPTAVGCARENIGAAGGLVYEGDLFDPLPASLRGRIDILMANVPYVPSEAVGMMPPEARLHEPLVALDGGEDGLDVARRVAAAAPQWLAPGGHLLVETGGEQAPRIAEVFAAGGLQPRVSTSDELGATVVTGTSCR